MQNEEFLKALFGDDAPFVHVTDFIHDPSAIPETEHLKAWRGGYFRDWRFGHGTNQYFTVSLFYCDEKGQARRRKSLYRSTPVIVLDDVKEKLSLEQAQRLPRPTWILETSNGSEQWGYLLNEPCTARHRVENLLDGLVANGLAPNGKDPGMKGVTRYVRLPDGYNTKASKRNADGTPFKCRLLLWEPFNRCTIEELAAPFAVDLDAARRDARVDGAAAVDDHPLLDVPDVIHIKEQRSEGRFDITCPWVDEHTGGVDNGAAIFTNADGTIGFKCHHGACEQRTGRHLLEVIEQHVPGFGNRLRTWQVTHSFKNINTASSASYVPPQAVQQDAQQVATPPSSPPAAPSAPVTEEDAFKLAYRQLRDAPPTSPEARAMASEFLRLVDQLPPIDKLHWHETVRTYMGWTKPELKVILADARKSWYKASATDSIDFMTNIVFVGELNQFYDPDKNIFYSPEGYQNAYAHLNPEIRKEALAGGLVMKVDKLDFAPMKPAVFTDKNIRFANLWRGDKELQGVQGDVSPYLEHFDVIGWRPYMKHILQFMAFTLRHPDKKINHMLILGSGEGAGKDWILTPMIRALAQNSRTINGEELTSNFTDYVVGVKHLHINEVELYDHRDASLIGARLKPLSAAPPHHLRVNPKNLKPFDVSNLLSVTMTTNQFSPIKIKSATRRTYALWTDFTTRDDNEEQLPEWTKYWTERWAWMNNGGADAVIWFLRNQVDLSDFNPGEPPPVTDYLRDIRNASMPNTTATVKGFIEAKYHNLRSDLLTIEEIISALKSGQLDRADLWFTPDASWLTPVKVGLILKELAAPKRKVILSCGKQVNLYVVRNRSVYMGYSQEELAAEYERQRRETLQSQTRPSLNVVA